MEPPPRPRGSRRTLYRAVDGVVVRAPLLPVTHHVGVSDRPEHHDPLVDQAICVASEDLWTALRRPDPIGGRRTQARLRYLIRGATRPTPYGLFAAVAVGAWAESTTLRIGDGRRRTRSRPDMGWLIAEVLRLEQEAPEQLRWVANTCAFEHAGRIYLTDPGSGGPSGPDVSVRATGPVRRVLAAARRPRAHAELVAAALDAAPEATPQRAGRLVDELCRLGLLHSDLRPPLTADACRHLRARLAGVPAAADTARRLADADRLIAELDATLGVASADPVPALCALRQRLRSAPADLPAVDGRPAVREVVQVDSALPLAGRTVSVDVATDAARAVDLLLRLHPAPGGPRYLADYRFAFLDRYGHDRRVPLLELLDPRFGLGPPDRRYGHQAHAPDRRSQRRRGEHLLHLASCALMDGSDEVELGPGDLDALSTWVPDPRLLTPSLELSTFVLASSPAAVDRGEYRLLVGPNLGALAAGRGLGRFADLLGDPATALLARIAAEEHAGAPGEVVAELTYLPREHRAANVAVRTAVRRHEIPVGVTAGVPGEYVVAPDELVVYVRDGRLRLWWDPRGVEVAVAAGHMLNVHGAPDVCRFLHEVGLDGRTPLAGFDWGPAADLPVLPRVRHGRIVLHPAQWRQSRERASAALHVRDGPAAFAAALPEWRRRWRVPEQVYLTAGDNRLLLDLDDPAQAELLRADLRRSSGGDLVLQEALPAPQDAWLSGPGGGYVCELVVPLVRRVPAVPGPPAPAQAADRVDEGDRRRPPGSDWLYLTLTGPQAAQDRIIAGPLREVADALVARGHAESWFFVRYADPEPALRLRLHGRPADLTQHALPAVLHVATGLIGTGDLHRAGLEVYEREVERYGGPRALDAVEELFAADSRAVAALLAVAGTPGERLAVAALGVHDLLGALGLDDAARLAWYSAEAPPARRSAAAHREHGRRIDELLTGTAPGDAAVREVLAARRVEVLRVAEVLARLRRDGTCGLPVPVLARSLVHMHCNRLGVDPSTEQVVLGLLRRRAHSRLRAARDHVPT